MANLVAFFKFAVGGNSVELRPFFARRKKDGSDE